MSDITKVCALCQFYEETSIECTRFPPNVKEKYINSDGDKDCHWDQPIIIHPWTTRCGEWQEINDPLEDENHPDYAAAHARLTIIVAAHKREQEENKEENNAPRDGTGNG
jgi:hypothetical protein